MLTFLPATVTVAALRLLVLLPRPIHDDPHGHCGGHDEKDLSDAALGALGAIEALGTCRDVWIVGIHHLLDWECEYEREERARRANAKSEREERRASTRGLPHTHTLPRRSCSLRERP